MIKKRNIFSFCILHLSFYFQVDLHKCRLLHDCTSVVFVTGCKCLNTHRYYNNPPENATSKRFNKYNLKSLNSWQTTVCLLLYWHYNIALFDVDRQKYSYGTLSFSLLWDGLRWRLLLCSLWPAHPCLSSWLPAHKTVSPIIKVLVIACKCPGAVETHKRCFKRVWGILFINFVLIRRQVFWQLPLQKGRNHV